MRVSCFIASRLGKNKTGKNLSGTGNFIAVLSVAISIAVIIISMAVSAGFRKEIKEKSVGFCGDAIIAPPGLSMNSELNPQNFAIEPVPYLSKIEELPFVEKVQGVSYRPGLIKTEDEIQGIVLKGVADNYDWDFFESSLIEGSIPAKDSSQVLVSKRIAQMLNLSLGERITLYFIADEIKVRRFRISGIYSAQLEDYDKLYVITDIAEVNSINGWGDGVVSNYEVLFKDHSEKQMDHRNALIASTIYNNAKDGDKALVVTGLKENMFRLLDWLHLLDMNVLIILILMIAVAGFNMISCILIILFENISTIGVFKTMGMKNSTVKEIFLVMSCKIVLYGLAAGNVFALLLCWLQGKYQFVSLNPDNYFLTHVPVSLSFSGVLVADVISFAAIMLILLLPCHFISKVNPAKTVKFK